MLFMLGCKKIWKVSINNVDDDIVYVISTNIESIFDKWYKIEDKFNHNKDDIKKRVSSLVILIIIIMY